MSKGASHTTIPISHLFTRIIQHDYPFFINADGHFQPNPSSIFYYLLKPSTQTNVHPDNERVRQDQLQHYINVAYPVPSPLYAGTALHKWALDTIFRQADILSNKIPVLAACKFIIDQYQIDDDLYPLETLYRSFYRWKKQTDTSDFSLKIITSDPRSQLLSRQETLYITGTVISQNFHLFYSTKGNIKTSLIKSLCQYAIYHYTTLKQKDIAKIYHCTQEAISGNITTARKFINHHSKFRTTLLKAFS